MSKLTHDVYKTGDADAPSSIKDRNGDVVLSLCRRCGKGESELTSAWCTEVMTPADDLPPLPALHGTATDDGEWYSAGQMRAYALAARAERDAEIERLNGLLLLGRDNAGTAKLLHDELKALLAQRDERIMELESLEQDINREYRLKLEVAEARVKELEHPAVHTPSLVRVKEAHSYMPLDRWPETTKAAHRMYAQSSAPAEETCYLCALIVLLDKAESERDALRARLEAIRKQPTIAYIDGGNLIFPGGNFGSNCHELIERPELP